MKKRIISGLLATIALVSFSACNATTPGISDTVANNTNQNNQPGVMPPGGMGPGGLPAELNLTTEQQQQIMELRMNGTPVQIDETKINEIKSLIVDSFSADTFSASDLGTKLAAIDTGASSADTEADIIIKTYNILSTEQKATLQSTGISLFHSRPGGAVNINFGSLESLSSSLSLSDEQKSSMESLLQNSFMPGEPQAGNQEIQTELNTLLNSGKATVETVKAILSKNSAPIISSTQIDNLGKIYQVLNAEQRKTFINGITIMAGGPANMGGPGGPGGQAPGQAPPDFQ